jgi:hypothetical protein
VRDGRPCGVRGSSGAASGVVLGWPALASLFLLPMVAVLAGSAAASRLGVAGGRRRTALAVVLLAVAGLAAYVSPIGVAAVRWFLD